MENVFIVTSQEKSIAVQVPSFGNNALSKLKLVASLIIAVLVYSLTPPDSRSPLKAVPYNPSLSLELTFNAEKLSVTGSFSSMYDIPYKALLTIPNNSEYSVISAELPISVVPLLPNLVRNNTLDKYLSLI